MFIGSVQIRSSRTNKNPRMNDFEKVSSTSKILTYTATEDGNLSEQTFYISAFGEIDAIYTITPHITFGNQKTTSKDPGILLFDGMKQDIVLTAQHDKQYFYFKVPVDEDNVVPKIQINLELRAGTYKICLDPD